MDAELQRIAPAPIASSEIVPHPRAERRRGGGRFALGTASSQDAEPSTEAVEQDSNELPVAPHGADEAGARLDLTA